MLLDPFKRIITLCVGHPVGAIEEAPFGVDFHQPADVDVWLVFEGADGELPVVCSAEVDHDLVNEI